MRKQSHFVSAVARSLPTLLKAAMVKALAKMEQEKKQRGQKISQKQPQKEKEDKTYKGKQSLE